MRSQPSRGEETVEAHLRPEVVEVALWWSSIQEVFEFATVSPPLTGYDATGAHF